MYKFLTILFLCFVITALRAQAPPVPGDWIITFEDDFDLDHIDPSKWRQGPNVSHFNGAASNDGHHIVAGDGTARLIAEKKTGIFSGRHYEYASGELTTFDLFRQVYGYIEARVKYDAVQGSWPAVWIMPDQGNRANQDLKRQAFIKFDLDTLSEPVDSAILYIKVKSLSGENCGFSVHRLLSDSWSETNLNWNNRPTCDPVWVREFTGTTDPARIDQIDAGTFMGVEVTREVNRALEEGIDPGFVLKDYFMKQAEIQFYSKEAVSIENRPYLEIDGVKVYPSDDATVRGGQYAETSYGAMDYISTMDPWASTSSTYDGGMEMDIMETLGIWGADFNQHALHWDGYGDDHQSVGSGKIAIPPTGDGFHTYGLFWEPGKVEFYTDGIKTWEHSGERIGSVPVYILLSHQMGGWDGNGTIIDEDLPSTVIIDYVRVYRNRKGAFVGISGPENGSVFGTGTSIPFNASVAEWGGAVTAVEFYAGDSLLARDTVSPYAITINGLERGEYLLSVRAIDPEGTILHADTARIIVSDLPEVSLSSPEDSSVYMVPVDLTFAADISPQETITEVEFLIDGDTVCILQTGPFSYEWKDVPPGTYHLLVKATDDLGLVGESDVRYFVVQGQEIPEPWVMKDIGSPELDGSGSYYNGMFLLEGSGKDAWGDADKMNFLYQGFTGDGEIVARITELSSNSPYAKGGVMMRETLSPGSVTAGIFVSNEFGGEFFRRTGTDGIAKGFSFNPELEVPVWLRLVRKGGIIRGYTSLEGSDWIEIQDFELQAVLEENMVAGLAVTSLLNIEPAETRIDHVELTGESYRDLLPQVLILSPSSDTLIRNELELIAMSVDPDGGEVKRVEFFADDDLIGVVNSEPFSFLWQNVPEGVHTLRAYGIDDEGSVGVSDPVFVSSFPLSVRRPGSEALPGILIHPVLHNGHFILSIHGVRDLQNGLIQLYDIQGWTVYSEPCEDPDFELDLSALKSGIYFVRFTAGTHLLWNKLILEN